MGSSREYLRDILQSMDRIAMYTKGLDGRAFSGNHLVTDAVLRNLEVMGEASDRMPTKVREMLPAIPWLEMTVSGRYILEQYEEVDPLSVWDIILLLKHLRPYIIEAIEREESDLDENS